MADCPRSIDAIRYVVLRKLAPGLRHKLLGSVQVVRFANDLCLQKLQMRRNPAELAVELAKIASQVTEMETACRLFADWLRPDPSSFAAFGETVDYCLNLTGDDWTLRGIQASVHVSNPAKEVILPRQVVCELLSTSLLVLIDLRSSAVDFELNAEIVDAQVALNIKSLPSTREAVLPPISIGGKLDWHDVLSLAEAHAVKCVCEPSLASITLHFSQNTGAITRPLSSKG